MRLNPHEGPEGHHIGIVRSVVLSVSVGHNNTIPVRRRRSPDPNLFSDSVRVARQNPNSIRELLGAVEWCCHGGGSEKVKPRDRNSSP
jgi:hypothetical protein